MKTVKDILASKGSVVHSIGPEASAYEVLELLAKHNVGALMVFQGEQIVGIVSERDIVRKVDVCGKASRAMTVQEVMSARVFCIPPERSVDEVMALMTEKHIRHLPVIQDDELLGVVSIGDVVKSVIAEKQFEIEQLENYIRGVY